MKVLVTGGAGFLGTALARSLLARQTLRGQDGREHRLSQLTLVDVVPSILANNPRVHALVGSITSSDVIRQAIEPETEAIFHLAAAVSGQAEADFDLGMSVNLDATRLLLERTRQTAHQARFIFASSVAVFGGVLPKVVLDDTAPTPQSSYGIQKLMCELLTEEYSRKGFVDGVSLRMPTICVRGGAPNRAVSGFASAIIREPLAGRDTVCPVNPDTVMWLMSPDRAIANLMHAQSLDAAALRQRRTLNMPGLSVAVGAMTRALENFAGAEAVRHIRWEPEPAIARIVNSWPGKFETRHATKLGFQADTTFAEIIRAHAEIVAVGSASAG